MSNDGVVSQERIEDIIIAITEVATDSSCNLLELSQACRSIQAACLAKMGDNAQKRLLIDDTEQ